MRTPTAERRSPTDTGTVYATVGTRVAASGHARAAVLLGLQSAFFTELDLDIVFGGGQ